MAGDQEDSLLAVFFGALRRPGVWGALERRDAVGFALVGDVDVGLVVCDVDVTASAH